MILRRGRASHGVSMRPKLAWSGAALHAEGGLNLIYG